MAVVYRPHTFPVEHVAKFTAWAGRVSLILDEVTLPYIQLAPVTMKKPSFLQGALRAYSQVRGGGGGGEGPPPSAAPTPANGSVALNVFLGETPD